APALAGAAPSATAPATPRALAPALAGAAPSATAPATGHAPAPAGPPEPPPPPTGAAGGAPDAWRGALQRKTTTVMIAFLAICAAGLPFMAAVARTRTAFAAAATCVAGIAAITAVQLIRARRGALDQLDWPWAVVAALCAGPAYLFGLNAGFAAVLAVGLFSNGGFTAAQRNPAAPAIPLAVVVSQGALLALIVAGVVPDDGLAPLYPTPDTPRWEPVIAHAMVQGVYLSAHAAGFVVDRAHSRMLELAVQSEAAAAHHRALLSAARAQLHRALVGTADGVFVGHRVGDYELTEFLGRGGMGEVYRGIHVGEGPAAAVKLIRADRFGDAAAVRLFVREASVLSRIDSPYVARVYATGGGDGDIPYIAMELLTGNTLAGVLRDRDTLSPEALERLVHDVGRGLEAVHSIGIIHRDLKPHNVMLVRDPEPRWKLVDFGIARWLDKASDHTTRDLVVGTPPYMAPETILGRPVDARADLYSFGLLIYRAVVGRPAFSSADPLGVLDEARRGPPNPRDYVDLPTDVELALRIAIAYDPADRFADAATMRHAFAAALAGSLPPALRRRGRALLARCPWATAAVR
ncbi:MAG: serine/threonine protein kinase, partial [Deltaproteobacteria bacterium]